MGIHIVCENRKARFLYEVFETMEAGLVLKGTEVKSLRDHQANLQDSFARSENGELWLHHMHIAPYFQGNRDNVDPVRTRKLLLNRRELERWQGKATQKGLSIIPLKVYFKDGYAKVELGLAKGKKAHDKRDSIKKRDAERRMRRGED